MNEINVTLKMNQTNLGTYRWRISLGRGVKLDSS